MLSPTPHARTSENGSPRSAAMGCEGWTGSISGTQTRLASASAWRIRGSGALVPPRVAACAGVRPAETSGSMARPYG